MVEVATIEGEKDLAQSMDAAREVSPELEIARRQREGHPVILLTEASANAQMVVVGATGRGGLTGMLIGSTALDLPARSHCPVVVVRPRDGGSEAPHGPVVVGVVGSSLDEPTVEFAFEQASARGVELVAVGTRGRGPLAGTLLGSTSRAVLKLSQCPVAVLRKDSAQEQGAAQEQ